MAYLSCRIFRPSNPPYSLRFPAENNYTYRNIGCNARYCILWARHGIFGSHFEDRVLPSMQQNRCITRPSSSSPGSGEPQSVEKLSIFQRFKKILHSFYVGGKVLYGDVKVTFKIRRKLKSNDDNYSVLSRKEQWTMFKTQKNLKKTLPIVILSCLPVIGYLGPIIGFLRPRQFLSHHFWTVKQKKKYQILDDKERSEYIVHVIKDINNQIEQITEEKQHDLISSFTKKTHGENIVPKNDMLVRVIPTFSTGVLKLENLQNEHLKNLCSFWLMSSWLPTSYLQKRLRRELVEIHKDDAAIIREGIVSLTDQEIDEACHVRGLNTSNVTSEDLVEWLHDWIDLSKQVSESETSFLAHAAVFKTVNFKNL